ncbi:hypothetical protein [Cryobacterium sp. TMT2-18-3]|uniref:hypothetical protein n=1 Tax=Cryobacterium sp. TMT2-18-3 TaxID=1259250 RepID=UPI00141B548B|nr:hypothetical protein [Cryobacterium sp. TMT2-18-3]
MHVASLRASLLDEGNIELTDPGESEDFGIPWTDHQALMEFGVGEATEPWTWAGVNTVADGPTWGGCIEVIDERGVHDAVAGVLIARPPVSELNSAVQSVSEQARLRAVQHDTITAVDRPARQYGHAGPDRSWCVGSTGASR